jgi:hypothetical protein
MINLKTSGSTAWIAELRIRVIEVPIGRVFILVVRKASGRIVIIE